MRRSFAFLGLACTIIGFAASCNALTGANDLELDELREGATSGPGGGATGATSGAGAGQPTTGSNSSGATGAGTTTGSTGNATSGSAATTSGNGGATGAGGAGTGGSAP